MKKICSDSELESKIQSRIIRRYQKEGFLVVKLILTNQNGFPDLMLLKDGVASFVEVKRPNEKPRPLQVYRINELINQGFKVDVLTN